jgi:hypothetical protein
MIFPKHQLAQTSGNIIFPNYQLALESGHTILPQQTIESCKRAYYFSPTLICPQQVGILFFQNSWLKQAGTLFLPTYQLAQASGHIIFPQLPNGSSKRAYYFPQLPVGSSQRAYYFFLIQLAPASGHIFPKH